MEGAKLCATGSGFLSAAGSGSRAGGACVARPPGCWRVSVQERPQTPPRCVVRADILAIQSVCRPDVGHPVVSSPDPGLTPKRRLGHPFRGRVGASYLGVEDRDVLEKPAMVLSEGRAGEAR